MLMRECMEQREAMPQALEEPTEKPNTFFSKDKNQIEKFPLSDFFSDYNLL